MHDEDFNDIFNIINDAAMAYRGSTFAGETAILFRTQLMADPDAFRQFLRRNREHERFDGN